ncbi:MAG TPA: hypothetical protein VGD22_05685 [Sphingobacteriaceae bacterium]
MTNKQIQAIGNFLTYYRTDLHYIKSFQDFKTGLLSAEKYTSKVSGSFYSFLIEFKVVRNFPKGTIDRLLTETILWVKGDTANDVDMFSYYLKERGVTNGVMASLASKILFLNNPSVIIPMDQLARNALNQKQNDYGIYLKNLSEFKARNETVIKYCLDYTKPLTVVVEQEFNSLQNLDRISRNRMIDKLLWTEGSRI